MNDKKKIEIEPGFYNDMGNEDYHKDLDYVSSSVLKVLLKDPKKYYDQYICGNFDYEYNPAFDFGNYFHTLVLEPELLETEYAIYEGAVRRGKEFEKFKAANEGKIIITKCQKNKALDMLKAVEEAEFCTDLLDTENHEVEQSLFSTLDGIKIKVRADHYSSFIDGGRIIDVKTTSDNISLTSLPYTIAKWDYDLSAALYVDLYTQELGMDHDFYFLFVTKRDPSAAILVKASKQMLENGRRKYKAAIRKLKDGRKTGIWFENGVPEIRMNKNDLFYDGGE